TGSNPAEAIEKLVPGDIQGLETGQMRYSVLLNDQGGIIDDLMITNMSDHLFVVVNAACKTNDIAVMKQTLGAEYKFDYLGDDYGLLALQGPKAVDILSKYIPECATMKFMTLQAATINNIPVLISRSGYTGEDGFEISV